MSEGIYYENHMKSLSFAGDPVFLVFSSRKVSHYLKLFVTSTFAVTELGFPCCRAVLSPRERLLKGLCNPIEK